MTHICVNKLIIIGPNNDLSPGRRQAIIWTNGDTLLIEPLGTIFSEILFKIYALFIQENAFENVVWKISANLHRPQWVKLARPLCHVTRSLIYCTASIKIVFLWEENLYTTNLCHLLLCAALT